ncbi:MAG: imidazolonepropionase [Rectinema subterraneum]|jgi:imidazolonepropionase
MAENQQKTLFVHNIGELWTAEGLRAAAGPAMGRVKKFRDACLYIEDGRISAIGEEARLRAELLAAPTFDAEGRACVPGFVDSHTHFIFAGWREDEFYWRAQGVPYMEMHRRGGGIQKSVDATRRASLEELVRLGKARLETMLSLGITTVEGKSGYGLDKETELRQLQAMDELSTVMPLTIIPTFLGAHSIPPEYKDRPREFLAFLVREVFPLFKKRGQTPFVDIFCEEGVFGIEDSRWYLEQARAAGFALKLHADEVKPLGGAGLAAELGATSADHLLKASDQDIQALAAAGTIACLLPLTAFNIREPYASGRRFIDAGCAVALASDLNPGSCYSQSIPLIFALAVLYLGMSIEEALTALTLNGAAALGLAAQTGSIEPGKDADFLLLNAPSPGHLAYHAGMNLVHSVFKRGILVWQNGNVLGPARI